MVKRLKALEAGHGFSKTAWDAVNSPELTVDEIAALRPAQEALPPALFAALTNVKPGKRGPQKAPTKAPVSLWLDRDVIDRFKAGGSGWHSRINAALRKAAG